jgi:hypothetical protein
MLRIWVLTVFTETDGSLAVSVGSGPEEPGRGSLDDPAAAGRAVQLLPLLRRPRPWGDRIPVAGVARPAVDPDYTATVGLAREEARALVAAADADRGPQALQTAAVIRLLLHNALRWDEACGADVAGLGADAGHRVLRG